MPGNKVVSSGQCILWQLADVPASHVGNIKAEQHRTTKELGIAAKMNLAQQNVRGRKLTWHNTATKQAKFGDRSVDSVRTLTCMLWASVKQSLKGLICGHSSSGGSCRRTFVGSLACLLLLKLHHTRSKSCLQVIVPIIIVIATIQADPSLLLEATDGGLGPAGVPLHS